jgi:8-oxo-dGTP pyrophosphatase MutT (NUDIX family)/GNAT superfamily N-acetyltransferase
MASFPPGYEPTDDELASSRVTRWLSGWGEEIGVGWEADGELCGAAWVRQVEPVLAKHPGGGGPLPELIIAVNQAHRSVGIGFALITGLLSVVDGSNAPGIALTVSEQNPAAIALYERSGFVLIGRHHGSCTMVRRRPGIHRPAEAINLAPVTIKGVCVDSARRVLLCRNNRGEWELPGGRPEHGENFPACLVREIWEETGLSARVRALIAAYPYETLPGRSVNVIVYGCDIAEVRPPITSREHNRVEFLDPDAVAQRELPAGYRDAIQTWTRRN